VTLLLSLMVTMNLAVLLGGDFFARLAELRIWHHPLAVSTAVSIHVVQWIVATGLLLLQFSTIYYFAPDLKAKRWHWMTPGAAIGISGWVLASLGLRVYLHYFNSFTITYGSLGAVIVLLTWFYMTGLMLLLGAEINSEIQAAVMEKKMKAAGEIPPEVSAEPEVAAHEGHAATSAIL
jgi:membrane protein